MAEIAEALVAVKRLQNFLELEEKQTKPIDDVSNGHKNGNGFFDDIIEVFFIFFIPILFSLYLSR